MPNNITVAICVYNCERYIEQTLTCLLSQTYQDFDILILNDCSTDSSFQIIDNFFTKYNRNYELINLKENRGIGYARHYVERYVQTKYLIFVDADDRPYPTLVEKLYQKILSDPDLMAVGCYLEYIDKYGDKIGGGLFLGEKTKENFYKKAENKKLIFMQPTAIYDRELALSVGGYNIEGFPEGKPRYQDFCEDLDLWTRMSDLYTQKKAIVIIPEILCQYRKLEQGLSANSLNMILKMRYVKSNLLKRRAGEAEQTFIEFKNSISPKELQAIEREVAAATHLRESVFALKNRKFWTAIKKMALAIKSKPKYVWQKVRHNLFK